jgi:hypothetical protein
MESKKGATFAFCSVCRCDFSVSHGGKCDIVKHMQSKKHKDNVQCIYKNRKLDFSVGENNSDSATRAEVLFTAFIAECNLSLNCANHAGPLFRKIFRDSEIAKKYGCFRTKTTSIISELGNREKEKMVVSL